MNKMKVLLICGSPRKGNSETLVNYLAQKLKEKKVKNEVVLLREKNIKRCNGCVEFCNKNLYCHIKDDMPKLIEKLKTFDAYVFVSPNYFYMPPGIFKDFIDRSSVLYTAEYDLSKKKAAVIVVGMDVIKESNKCVYNIAEYYCKTMKMRIVAKKAFKTNSELKGNYNDIFENNYNKNIKKDLEKIVEKIIK